MCFMYFVNTTSTFVQFCLSIGLFLPVLEAYVCLPKLYESRSALFNMFWLINGLVIAYAVLVLYGVLVENDKLLEGFLAYYGCVVVLSIIYWFYASLSTTKSRDKFKNLKDLSRYILKWTAHMPDKFAYYCVFCSSLILIGISFVYPYVLSLGTSSEQVYF
jgi:hypothetical protein